MLKDRQNSIIDETSALKIMLEQPSIIKRPIIDLGHKQIIGFDEKEYAALNKLQSITL